MDRFTSYSRYTSRINCYRKGFLSHHYQGTGLSLSGSSPDLLTGTYLDNALSGFLRHYLSTGNPPTREESRSLILGQSEAYREHFKREPFSHPLDDSYTLEEQISLSNGLFWTWIKLIFPYLIEHYELIAVQREERAPLGCRCGEENSVDPLDHPADCPVVILKSIPDMVWRRKSDGKLSNMDFKSTKDASYPSWLQEFKTSLQMVFGTLGIEHREKQECAEYVIHALVKGARGKTGHDKQNSPFCYLKFDLANPPLHRTTTISSTAKLAERTPVWLETIPDKDPSWTNQEWVVENLDQKVLREQVLLTEPYPRQDSLLQEFRQEIYSEEQRWRERLRQNSSSPDPSLYPRNPKNCFAYGRRCEFYQLCYPELTQGEKSIDFKARVGREVTK